MYIYISTHFLTSQPTLIKLDNENIGGHLTPLQLRTGPLADRDPQIFRINSTNSMIADADHDPRTPIRSFRTRNLGPHTTGQAACRTLRRKESSIMADESEC